jgi:hypothetical protein
MEVRELLSKYDFPGDDTPIIAGSARLALEGDQSDIGVPAIIKLVDSGGWGQAGYLKEPKVTDEIKSFRLGGQRDLNLGFISRVDLGANYTERENLAKARNDRLRKGPVIMMALTKGGQDPDDPKMLVRGFLVEFFATAMLVAVIGLAGSGHGRLRRFLTLLAMVAFMNLGTHMLYWAFMYAPNAWTAVLVFDTTVGWTLAGLPAVFLMRCMREGDTAAA